MSCSKCLQFKLLIEILVVKEILVVFHNCSTYDYHFIITKLAKEFKRQFGCLGENTEKYITFSVPIKNDKKITYKIKFIDSFRFMSTSLSNLVDNLFDRLHSNKCADCKSYFDYISHKDDQLIFRCNAKKLIRKIFIRI